jgi:hypothetical protein
MGVLFAFYYVFMFALIPIGVAPGGNYHASTWQTVAQVVLIFGCVVFALSTTKQKNSGSKLRNGVLAYSIATFASNVCIAWWPR